MILNMIPASSILEKKGCIDIQVEWLENPSGNFIPALQTIFSNFIPVSITKLTNENQQSVIRYFGYSDSFEVSNDFNIRYEAILYSKVEQKIVLESMKKV